MTAFAATGQYSYKVRAAAIFSNTIWGAESNGFRVGLYIQPPEPRDPQEGTILISLLNLPTTNRLGYYERPNRFPAYLELRSKNGDSIPLRDESTQGTNAFPKSISSSEIPYTSRGVFAGEVALYPSNTTFLAAVNLRKQFKAITNSGRYTLTVWPKIYKFSSNLKSLNLVRLAPATIDLDLEAELPRERTKGSVGWIVKVGGWCLLLLSVMWLIRRRQQRADQRPSRWLVSKKKQWGRI